MQASRLKVVSVAAFIAVALLAATGVVLGSMTDDADAARRPPLKLLWANVGSDGFLNAGKGATAATKSGTGSYEVTFVRNVIGCAHTATLRGASSGEVSVGTSSYFTPDAGSQFAENNEVVVFTYDSAGAYANRATYVVINC